MKLRVPFVFLTLFFVFLSPFAVAETVDVNTATSKEIASTLPGVGPSKAEAILKHCRETSCTKAEDLLAIKGIGQKGVEKMKPFLTFTKADTAVADKVGAVAQ